MQGKSSVIPLTLINESITNAILILDMRDEEKKLGMDCFSLKLIGEQFYDDEPIFKVIDSEVE